MYLIMYDYMSIQFLLKFRLLSKKLLYYVMQLAILLWVWKFLFY